MPLAMKSSIRNTEVNRAVSSFRSFRRSSSRSSHFSSIDPRRGDDLLVADRARVRPPEHVDPGAVAQFDEQGLPQEPSI